MQTDLWELEFWTEAKRRCSLYKTGINFQCGRAALALQLTTGREGGMKVTLSFLNSSTVGLHPRRTHPLSSGFRRNPFYRIWILFESFIIL